MDQQTLDSHEEQWSLQRTTILRIYNYYRIGISFLFLFLFVDTDFNEFVGQTDPDLFLTAVVGYIVVNVLISLLTFFVRVELLSKTGPSFVILTLDVMFMTVLMNASGGVSSGLANCIIFTVSFGGGLILGRISTVLPAIAFILTLYGEFYLNLLGQNSFQSFFQAGLIGIVYFVANILFQSVSRALRAREEEVWTLEKVNQLVIDRMRIGVVVMSPDGDIRLINESAQELLETPNLGSTSKKLPYTLTDLLNQWKSERDEQRTLNFHTHASGVELLAQFSTTTDDDNADSLIFIEDSSEAQKQAQQLKLAALGRLSASIAHEIRNPLGAISHAAQLLAESQQLDKGDLRLTEIIGNHCNRMNGVIENVLQMSRRRTAEPQHLLMSEWIDGFMEDFTAGVRGEADVRVELDPPDLALYVDPLHLSQVLGNLCQNGLRYSASQTGEFRVDFRGGVDSTSNHPYLEVVDYGPGVPKDQEKNLFEPFFTTEATGTGLGLYLSSELCAANGARLTYSRAEDAGSCFRITFLQRDKQRLGV